MAARLLTRRDLLRDMAFAGAALAAAGCAQGANRASPGATPSKRLTLSWWTDTGYPSPFTFSNLGPGGVVKETLLFDSLVWKDANGLIPWLAESWDVQAGGRRIVFKLRPNVAWHDGQPFTADDVAFSFAYFSAHPFSWADLSSVSGATTLDPRTVAIQLRQPLAPFIHDVAGVLPMIPKHVWSSVGDPLKFTGPASVTGTGPFMFASYTEGQGAYLFKANDRYFHGPPIHREIAYALVPEAQQVLALRNNEVDVALSTQYDVQQQFQGGRYQVLKTPPFSIVRLVSNINRPPVDRIEFRRAIAHALDRRQIAERVTHGDVTVGSPGVVPPGSPWYEPDVRQYPYDPNTAKALLRQIGYDGSTRVQLLSDPTIADAELVRSMLAQVGIAVDLVTVDPKTRAARLKALDYQMALTVHIAGGGDPDFLRRWYTGHAFNAFEQGNILHRPDFSTIAEQQASELDGTRRHRLVSQLQRILADELPTLPLYHRHFYLIYAPSTGDHWFNTWAGIMGGIPLADNKLAMLHA